MLVNPTDAKADLEVAIQRVFASFTEEGVAPGEGELLDKGLVGAAGMALEFSTSTLVMARFRPERKVEKDTLGRYYGAFLFAALSFLHRLGATPEEIAAGVVAFDAYASEENAKEAGVESIDAALEELLREANAKEGDE